MKIDAHILHATVSSLDISDIGSNAKHEGKKPHFYSLDQPVRKNYGGFISVLEPAVSNF